MPTIEKRNNAYRIIVSAGYDAQGKQIKKKNDLEAAPHYDRKTDTIGA